MPWLLKINGEYIGFAVYGASYNRPVAALVSKREANPFESQVDALETAASVLGESRSGQGVKEKIELLWTGRGENFRQGRRL